MATVPTLLVNSVDQTDYIHHKTLGFRLKTLDFTLIDPVTEPVLHNTVSLDEPEWHGRVSTIESTPFKSANGDDHRYVKVTATNKHTAVSDTAPFGLSDTPNFTTTFPFKDLVVIRTLADQSDLASAEFRVQATIYEPGIVPGMTADITCTAESLSAEPFIVTEMTVSWIKDDSPEFRLEFSDTGVPPITLGDLIDGSDCDCPPFNADDCADSVGSLSCVANDANTYTYTEGGTRSGLGPGILEGDGNYHYTSTDFTSYWRTGGFGGPSSQYQIPGEDTEMGNGGVTQCIFTSGTFDYFPGGAAQVVRIRVVGPGLLTVHSIAHPGGMAGACPTATVIDANVAVSGGAVSVATASGPIGIALDVTVPDDGECAHYIDITGTDGSWGYGGSNWTPNLTGEICQPSPGQPILPEHFTGDGVTDTFTLAWPYMPGSLEVYVEGIDWSDQVIEDDPTIGDFSLAYPPPAATDPEPNIEVHYRYPKP